MSEKKTSPMRLFLKNNLNRDMLVYGGMEFTYWAASATYSFLSAYYAENGLNSGLVGILMALGSLMGIIGSTIIGNISDKKGKPREVFIFLILLSSFLYATVPAAFRVHLSGSITLGVVICLIWSFFCRPMQGLCENLVVTAADTKRTFTFGSVRYWGSISYALINWICGFVINRVGTQAFTFYFFGFLSIPLLLLVIHSKRTDELEIKRPNKNNKAGLSVLIKNYYLMMFLVCHCLIVLPMSTSVTFLPYKLLEINGNTNALGAVSGIRAFLEIPMILSGNKLIKKFGIKNVFLIDSGLFLLSQLFFIFGKSTLFVAFGMMCMGLAYGAHILAQVNYVHKITPPEASTSAQSLAVSFMLVASVAGSVFGGFIVDAFTTTGLYIVLFSLEALGFILHSLTYPIGKLLKKQAPDLTNVID